MSSNSQDSQDSQQSYQISADDITRIRAEYDKALSYQQSDPEACLSTARRIAEDICKQLLEAETTHSPKGLMLNKLIGKLNAEPILPGYISAPLRTIQSFGNVGTHPQRKHAGHLTPEYVKPCVYSLYTVVKWYLECDYTPDADGLDTLPSPGPPTRLQEQIHPEEIRQLKQQVAELQELWDLLSEQLSKLRRDHALETRSDEKLRLKPRITDTEVERQQVGEQLIELKKQLPSPGEPPVSPAPKPEGIDRILITSFDKELSDAIQSKLQRRFGASCKIEITRIPTVIQSAQGAKHIGKQQNATLVIWGEDHTKNDFVEEELTLWISLIEQPYIERTHIDRFCINRNIPIPPSIDELTAFIGGVYYYVIEDYESAFDYFDQVAEEFEKSFPDRSTLKNKADKEYGASIYNFRGVSTIYGKNNDYERALADFEKAIEVHSRWVWAYHNRANIYFKKDDYDKALAEYKKAFEIIRKASEDIYQPADIADLFYSQGLVYSFREDWDEAITYFKQAVELNPKDVWAYTEIGWTYYYKDEYVEAIEQHTTAIKINPAFAEGYNNRGLAYHANKEYRLAIEDFEKALEIDDKLDEAYDSYAWLLATCPDEEYRNGSQAVDLAEQAVKLASNDASKARFLNTLAAAYAENGCFDKAKETQQEALQLVPPQSPLKNRFEERLQAYKHHTPWRE